MESGTRLDKMREETKDGHERWALVGFREDMQNLVLPRVFGLGTKTDYQNRIGARIPYKVRLKEIQKAKVKTRVVNLVGDIHSHPQSSLKSTVNELFGRRIFSSDGGFSAADLYRMVIQEQFLPMTALVDGYENFFVFNTRESIDIPTSSNVFSQDSFEKYWYEKYGVRLEGDFAKYIPPGFKHLQLNKGIAKKHGLVLYKGNPREDLIRISP